MLRRLHIRNYAIIQSIEVEFSKGLNIITGETGAGKSILVGALGLVLGERADASVIPDKEKKCFVEGVFDHPGNDDIKSFFIQHDIEPESEIILRREISGAGKSRAFINDTPVNLLQLQELSSMLVDLHQQFDSQELGRNHFQLQVLDALAKQLPLRTKYASVYQRFTQVSRLWENLVKEKTDALKEYDYFHFLFSELEEAGFCSGELEKLEGEMSLLSHAEQVNNVLYKLSTALDSSDAPITQQLRSLAQAVEGISNFHPKLALIAERLRSSQIEIRDISAEAEIISSGIVMDERRMDEVSERLSAGYKLLKKHGVKNTDELLEVQKSLSEKISKVLNMDEDIKIAEKEKIQLGKEAEDLAAIISSGRKAQVMSLLEMTHRLLNRVGMPNARLKISLEPDSLSLTGSDAVEFLFDANKSGRFEPLRKVASGGEFSRLLLCIKTLVAGSLEMPVLIFDEIDTGISGEAAKQVGILMKEMGNIHQVIAITHQPQIAARANAHFYVYKKEQQGAVRTQLRQLGEAERVESIARMMSGEKPSASALENAREMIDG
jgi:DNA repair protein RecN (Recombination protein N)